MTDPLTVLRERGTYPHAGREFDPGDGGSVWRHLPDECEWCQALAAVETLIQAMRQIEALDGGYPDDYCSIARAALAPFTNNTP